MDHSSIGPSSIKRIIACPGSVALVAQSPPKPPSPYAEEGSLAHTVAEAWVNGESLPNEATEEMLDGAALYSRTIYSYLDNAIRVSVGLRLENRVKADSIDDKLWGTCDAYFIADDTIFVFDYKFGAGTKVEAKNNEQLLAYATGIRDTHNVIVSKLVLVIVQPRNGGVSVWETPSTILTEFRHAVKTALASDTLAINSECKWCAAEATCPKKFEAIKEKFSVDIRSQITKLPEVEGLPAEQYKIYLDNADLLESWVKAVRSQAFAAAGRGLIIDGYEITSTLGNRKWRKGAEDEIKQGYPDIKLYEQPKFKSPAQLEKLLPKEVVDQYSVRETSGSKLQRTTKSAPDLFEHFTVIGDE